jgi:hypothetical protein
MTCSIYIIIFLSMFLYLLNCVTYVSTSTMISPPPKSPDLTLRSSLQHKVFQNVRAFHVNVSLPLPGDANFFFPGNLSPFMSFSMALLPQRSKFLISDKVTDISSHNILLLTLPCIFPVTEELNTSTSFIMFKSVFHSIIPPRDEITLHSSIPLPIVNRMCLF